MTLSTQHLIDKVRKPRVHITYDVQVGDAIEKKELPFVVGILADLSGMPLNPLPKMRDRQFTYIDSENLDEVFSAANPRITYEVKDVINPGADGSNMISIELNMKSIDDFSPLHLVKNIPQLRPIYDEKVMMKDLLAKAESNELLTDILRLLKEDPDTRNSLKQIIQTMKAQLAPKAEAASAAAAAKDMAIDGKIKEEIKEVEAKKKGAKNTTTATTSTKNGGGTTSVDTKDKDKS